MIKEQLAELERLLTRVKPEKIIHNTEYGILRLNREQENIWWKERGEHA